MRLDFNVLWIDNQPQNVKSYQERLDIKLQEEGFKLRITDALSFEEAEKHLKENIFLDNIDLVLVDYDLGAGVMKGDIAVREIRNLIQYKDIILYSSIQTVDLKEKVLTEGIEGVFCAHRDDLSDTMIGVFDALVKKVLDIDSCRGIVMGVTSDIDQIVLDCLIELSTKIEKTHTDEVVKYALEKLNTQLEKATETRDKLAAEGSIISLLKAHEAFTSTHKLGLLKKFLEFYYPNDHISLRKAVGKYNNDILPPRNILGHVRLVAEGGTHALRGRGAKTVTAEQLKELRQKLIVYRDNFDELANIIGLTFDEVIEISSAVEATPEAEAT